MPVLNEVKDLTVLKDPSKLRMREARTLNPEPGTRNPKLEF
jgi:hypothetical protein